MAMNFQTTPRTAQKSRTGKVIIAALAGAGAGLLAGVLLAPENGATTRKSLKGLARKAGEQARKTGAMLRPSHPTPAAEPSPTAWAGHPLVLLGDWNIFKAKLQAEYPHLTDKDLAYVKGNGQALVNRLQARLSKSESAIIEMLNAL